MGEKLQSVFKPYSSLKSLLIFSKLLLNFVLIGPEKSTVTFWIFEFMIFHFFYVFIIHSHSPYGPGAKTSDGYIKLLLNFSNFPMFLTKDFFWSFYFMIFHEFYCGNSLSPLCHIGKPTQKCYNDYHERGHRKANWSGIVSLG